MEESKYKIYRITCLVNKRVYIGATNLSINQRLGEHFRFAKKSGPKHNDIYFDIPAFGKDAFIIAVLEENLTQEEARGRETYWIRWYGENGYNLYNKNLGGGHIEFTDAQKKSVCEMYAAGKSSIEIGEELDLNPATITRILKHCGAEIRGASKPVYCLETDAVYASACEASRVLGINRSTIADCCISQSISANGKHFCFADERDTFEIRNNLHDKPVYCFETDTVYPTAAAAARELGLDNHKISACCRKDAKQTGGKHFCFEEDKDNFVIPDAKKKKPVTRAIYCVETDTVYANAHEAARQLGLSHSSISACCRGTKKSTHGMHFRYA